MLAEQQWVLQQISRTWLVCPGHHRGIKQHCFSHSIGKNGQGLLELGWKMLVPMYSWRQGVRTSPLKPWLGVLARCRNIYWEFLSPQFRLFLTLLLSIPIPYPVQSLDWFGFSNFWDIATEA